MKKGICGDAGRGSPAWGEWGGVVEFLSQKFFLGCGKFFSVLLVGFLKRQLRSKSDLIRSWGVCRERKSLGNFFLWFFFFVCFWGGFLWSCCF